MLENRLREAYEASPEFMRRTVGDLAGRLPSRLLYGRAFSETSRRLREEESWSAEERARRQDEALRDLLCFAGRTVPYYRGVFESLGAHPESDDPRAVLAAMPFLTRADVATLETRLVPEGLPKSEYKYATTGGTSGVPLGFYVTHEASAREWAFILAAWARVGFRRGDRRAVLRGRLVRGRESGRLWEHDPVNSALYLSSFDMSERNLDEYLALLAKYKPRFIHAYPSSATVLAQHMRRRRATLPSVKGLLLGSENLYESQRRYLEEVFGCGSFSWYGHSEKCILAAECERERSYHLFSQYGTTELLDGSGRVTTTPGVRGTIVGTGFINRATVFIRYVTDDQAEWLETPCPCGRPGARLAGIVGRWTQEVLVGRSGAIIPMAAVNLHSRVYTSLARFRFVQDTPGRAVLLVVPGETYDDRARLDLLAEIDARVGGELEVSIETVDKLEETGAGKYRFVDQRVLVDVPVWRD